MVLGVGRQAWGQWDSRLAGSLQQKGSLSRSSMFFPLVSRTSRKLAATEANLTTRISISPWRSFLLPITIILCSGSHIGACQPRSTAPLTRLAQPSCLPLNHGRVCLFCFETPCSQGRHDADGCTAFRLAAPGDQVIPFEVAGERPVLDSGPASQAPSRRAHRVGGTVTKAGAVHGN
ncbi:uncharacterized protein B0H64DRAFT_113353 [Chaetomium fimeti]|uniref:Uncharacterized protein n=1 Tax=Chaetomium fimeti TaxID=1854472 RepID=A0AAE0LU60_9PEZI|nr:hypothetical protein B0H64DRAFT_113353 [Chaetomium fimeti]